MLICPKCGYDGKIYIVDSRQKEWGTSRIRWCKKCNYEFSTIEVCRYEKDAFDFMEKNQTAIDRRTNNKEKVK